MARKKKPLSKAQSGQLGGLVSTQAKAATARANGAKGGRPKTVIKLQLPPKFLAICKEDNVDPEQVIRGFIADLAGINPADDKDSLGYCDEGSDECLFARRYYDRRGYPWMGGSEIPLTERYFA